MTDKTMLAAAPEHAPLPDDVAAMVERLRNVWVQPEAADMLERLARELAKHQESSFHPDWSMLEAARESLREHMRELATLRAEADPEALSIAHEYGFQRGKEAMQKELAAVKAERDHWKKLALYGD